MTTLQDKNEEFSKTITELNQKSALSSFDKILSFEFNDYDLHGDIVQTNNAIKGLLEGHSYPKCIQNLLFHHGQPRFRQRFHQELRCHRWLLHSGQVRSR